MPSGAERDREAPFQPMLLGALRHQCGRYLVGQPVRGHVCRETPGQCVPCVTDASMGRGKGIHRRWARFGGWGKAWRGRGVGRYGRGRRGGAKRRLVAATDTACLPVPSDPPRTALLRGGGFFGERRGHTGLGPFGVSCGAVLRCSASSSRWWPAWGVHPLPGWLGRREFSQLMSAIWRRAAAGSAARGLRVRACSSLTTGASSTGGRE